MLSPLTSRYTAKSCGFVLLAALYVAATTGAYIPTVCTTNTTLCCCEMSGAACARDACCKGSHDADNGSAHAALTKDSGTVHLQARSVCGANYTGPASLVHTIRPDAKNFGLAPESRLLESNAILYAFEWGLETAPRGPPSALLS